MQNAQPDRLGILLEGCLTMTYFRARDAHYHRRATVSRSCSRREGVVPAGYGRQALRGERSPLGTALGRQGVNQGWVAPVSVDLEDQTLAGAKL